jgi:hypothetical protein
VTSRKNQNDFFAGFPSRNSPGCPISRAFCEKWGFHRHSPITPIVV